MMEKDFSLHRKINNWLKSVQLHWFYLNPCLAHRLSLPHHAIQEHQHVQVLDKQDLKGSLILIIFVSMILLAQYYLSPNSSNMLEKPGFCGMTWNTGICKSPECVLALG